MDAALLLLERHETDGASLRLNSGDKGDKRLIASPAKILGEMSICLPAW